MASQDGIHERDLATRDRECSLVCCAQAASAVSWDCLDGAVDQLKLTSFDPESTVKANSRDVDRRCAVLEHEQWRLQSGDGHVRTTINPHLHADARGVGWEWDGSGRGVRGKWDGSGRGVKAEGLERFEGCDVSPRLLL
eukprot:1569862-Prymnesium_polylepis.2